MKKQIREIRVCDLLKYALLPLIVAGVMWTALILVREWLPLDPILIYVVGGVGSYVLAHYFAIGLVLVYKAFAPMSLRSQCRFEPSCSTYMILALQKYGLVRGFIKGVARIIRCRPPNGGIDYP